MENTNIRERTKWSGGILTDVGAGWNIITSGQRGKKNGESEKEKKMEMRRGRRQK